MVNLDNVKHIKDKFFDTKGEIIKIEDSKGVIWSGTPTPPPDKLKGKWIFKHKFYYNNASTIIDVNMNFSYYSPSTETNVMCKELSYIKNFTNFGNTITLSYVDIETESSTDVYLDIETESSLVLKSPYWKNLSGYELIDIKDTDEELRANNSEEMVNAFYEFMKENAVKLDFVCGYDYYPIIHKWVPIPKEFDYTLNTNLSTDLTSLGTINFDFSNLQVYGENELIYDYTDKNDFKYYINEINTPEGYETISENIEDIFQKNSDLTYGQIISAISWIFSLFDFNNPI